MKKIVLGLFALCAVWFIVFLFTMGYFNQAVVSEQEMGPFRLVYQEHTGSYRQAGRIQDLVADKLRTQYDVRTFKGFSILYDDPETKSPNELKSSLGCIVEPSDYPKLDQVAQEFAVVEYPVKRYMVVEFPFKDTVSVLFGPYKALPALEHYQKSKNYKRTPRMEIYDFQNRKIIYMMEIQA